VRRELAKHGVARWAVLAWALVAAGCGESSSSASVEGPVATATPASAVTPWRAAEVPVGVPAAPPLAEGREAAVLGDTIFVVDAGSLRAVSATEGPHADALAAIAFAAEERPSSPVVRREPLGVDSAEVFIAVAVAADARCTLRGLTRRLDPVWSREVLGACVQPGIEGETLLWPVADAFGPRVERLDPTSGGWLGAVSLPAPAVAPAARVGDSSGRWVIPLLDGAALIDASGPAAPPLLDYLALPDLRPTSALAPGGEHVVLTAHATSQIASSYLGDRLVRLRVTVAGALAPAGDPIVTPRPIEAAPIGASPDCTAATGGSHWWCGGGGFVATGGSHWLGGYDLATGATLFDVAPPQLAVQSVSLGADGRIYTGGSHWLGGFELEAFDPTLAPDPAAFQLILARPDAPAALLPSVAFTCGQRTAVLVDPGAGGAELVLTDAEATSAPVGTWARPFGGGDNTGQSASPDACDLNAPASACGDSVLDPGEACDDGNTADEDLGSEPSCSADCRVQRQLVNAAVPLPLADLVGGPFKSVRSVRVRYLSAGVRVYGELCVPNAPGPFPVLLLALEGPEPTAHVWGSELCGFAASQGAVVAAAQTRGRGGASEWPSEGAVEVCRGEVDDLMGLAEIASALPEAAPDQIGAFGAGFGACTVTALAARGAHPGASSNWPGVGAIVLAASLTDASALHDRHATEPPPAALSPLLTATLEDATAGVPSEAPIAYALRSPALFADALFASQAAVMLVHATNDPNWPVAQSCALRAALMAQGASFFDAQVSANAPVYLASEFVAFPACPGMNFATADPAWANVDFAFIAIQDTGTYDFTQLGMAAAVQRMVDFFKAHASK
jgi:cysteine-rich repeat protein